MINNIVPNITSINIAQRDPNTASERLRAPPHNAKKAGKTRICNDKSEVSANLVRADLAHRNHRLCRL